MDSFQTQLLSHVMQANSKYLNKTPRKQGCVTQHIFTPKKTNAIFLQFHWCVKDLSQPYIVQSAVVLHLNVSWKIFVSNPLREDRKHICLQGFPLNYHLLTRTYTSMQTSCTNNILIPFHKYGTQCFQFNLDRQTSCWFQQVVYI